MHWNDEMGSRNRRRKLLVGLGDNLHEFGGTTIPGVVVVAGSRYTKNGKWSFTAYDLVFAPAAWHYEAAQSWEEGNYFQDAKSVADAAGKLAAAGCGADAAKVVEFLRDKFPKTCERLDGIAAGLASVLSATPPAAAPTPEDELYAHMVRVYQSRGLDAVRAVIARFDGSLVN